MNPGRIKQFLLDWVLPPGLVAAHRRRMIPDLQKFWTGSPVPAPPLEAASFRASGFESATITQGDDSRACVRISGSARLPLSREAQKEAVQFAVVPVADWPSDARMRVTVGSQTTVHMGLLPHQWLDVRLDVPAGATHLDIVTDADIHLSFPRPVRINSTAPGALRHVIVLILDGWTTRLLSEHHPTESHTPLTPNIDRYFSGGLEASNGYSSSEWTMPTVASFFTGLCTARHRTFHPYNRTQLPTDRPLLAELFQTAGFHTLCMSVANRLTPAYGHHRGFDRFLYHFPEPGFTQRAYDPAVWLADLTGHLDAHRRDKTFSYVHLPDPHPVWEIPPLTRAFNLGRRGDSTGGDLKRLRQAVNAAEQGRQLYLLRLHEIDRLLGGMFDYIERNIGKETLVVLTADHGTPWHHLRENRPGDEPYLVDDRTAISLRMRGPGIPERRVESLIAPNLDLMPTLLARAGLPVPGDLDGQDLLSPAYRRDYVISESLYNKVYEIAVRNEKRTYVEKYPLDEQSVRLAGPAFYRGLFPIGTSDYGHPLAEIPGNLAEIAHAHLEKTGLNTRTP
jgi:arylsulfatase A-like enzyme